MARGLVLHYLQGVTVDQAIREGQEAGLPDELLESLPGMVFPATSAACAVHLGEKTFPNVIAMLVERGAPEEDAELSDAGRLDIHFTDESVLAIEVLHSRLAVAVRSSTHDAAGGGLHAGPEPTLRQREYLEFIARYILRYGVSPAESDIGRHFLLSAPAVNRMIQTLERRGFITRKRGVPRSIAIVNRLHRLVPSDQLPAPGS